MNLNFEEDKAPPLWYIPMHCSWTLLGFAVSGIGLQTDILRLIGASYMLCMPVFHMRRVPLCGDAVFALTHLVLCVLAFNSDYPDVLVKAFHR